MFIEDIQSLLSWAVALVLALIAAFLVFLARRRVQRHRYFLAKDAARARYKSVIAEATAGKTTPATALTMLQTGTQPRSPCCRRVPANRSGRPSRNCC